MHVCSKVIDSILLSNDKIWQRIGDLAGNVKALVSRMKSTKSSLQMDESTSNVASLATLLVFVRFPHLNTFQENLLRCKTLPISASGTDIFKFVNRIASYGITMLMCTLMERKLCKNKRKYRRLQQ